MAAEHGNRPGSAELVANLLSAPAGADVAIKDVNGDTALHVVARASGNAVAPSDSDSDNEQDAEDEPEKVKILLLH